MHTGQRTGVAVVGEARGGSAILCGSLPLRRRGCTRACCICCLLSEGQGRRWWLRLLLFLLVLRRGPVRVG